MVEKGLKKSNRIRNRMTQPSAAWKMVPVIWTVLGLRKSLSKGISRDRPRDFISAVLRVGRTLPNTKTGQIQVLEKHFQGRRGGTLCKQVVEGRGREGGGTGRVQRQRGWGGGAGFVSTITLWLGRTQAHVGVLRAPPVLRETLAAFPRPQTVACLVKSKLRDTVKIKVRVRQNARVKWGENHEPVTNEAH